MEFWANHVSATALSRIETNREIKRFMFCSLEVGVNKAGNAGRGKDDNQGEDKRDRDKP